MGYSPRDRKESDRTEELTLSLSVLQSVSSVAQSCLTLCDPMDRSMPGFPVLHQVLEFAQTHVY